MEHREKPKGIIVIFGATGDLARRKLFPSIYHLYQNGRIDEDFAVIGVARRPWTNAIFREKVSEALVFSGASENVCESFTNHFYYHPFDVTDDDSYRGLNELVTRLEGTYTTEGNRMFYLAMAPEFFGTIANNLKIHGLKETSGWTRLLIEKPFGHDLPSANALNDAIGSAFKEDQIYRIDHYLGKEMVQNIEVIRFANGIFEHLWNNRFIANIQVTSSETVGVEDRARYYDEAGALRDMVQNHMLQMTALLAMEPPINLTPEEIRSEKVRVLRALRPVNQEQIDSYFVRGQYGPGMIDDQTIPGYAEELGHDSNTETYVAARLMIDNYRWAGVPFYIRTGKRMKAKATKIVVEFKDIPMNLYRNDSGSRQPNLLVITINPNEGVTLHLNAKKPGTKPEAKPIRLAYTHDADNTLNTPEAYEKLLYDCMLGDMTNFTHWDEVALSWAFIDEVSQAWEAKKADFPNYAAGEMGPEAANDLLAQDGFHWWHVTGRQEK